MTGLAIWCGLALAVYVAGISFFAQWESRPDAPHFWPSALLAMPICLAIIVNANGYRESALLLSLVLGLWVLRSLRPVFWPGQNHVGHVVAHLLPGIVLVDWLAVADAPKQAGFIFVPLFLLALLLQRFVPAT